MFFTGQKQKTFNADDAGQYSLKQNKKLKQKTKTTKRLNMPENPREPRPDRPDRADIYRIVSTNNSNVPPGTEGSNYYTYEGVPLSPSGHPYYSQSYTNDDLEGFSPLQVEPEARHPMTKELIERLGLKFGSLGTKYVYTNVGERKVHIHSLASNVYINRELTRAIDDIPCSKCSKPSMKKAIISNSEVLSVNSDPLLLFSDQWQFFYCKDKNPVKTEYAFFCQGCFHNIAMRGHAFTCAGCKKRTIQTFFQGHDQKQGYCYRCTKTFFKACADCKKEFHLRNLPSGVICAKCSEIIHNTIKSDDFKLTEGIERRFGIELEFWTPKIMASPATSDELYIYDTFAHRIKRLKFNLGNDGSIRHDEGFNGRWSAFEVKSGIIQGSSGMKRVHEAVNIITEAEGRVNKSCGFHVHIDIHDLEQKEIARVMSWAIAYENIFYMLVSRERRDNQYCRRLDMDRGSLKTYAKKNLDVKQIFYGISRYKAFNIQAYWKYGTLEFRHHEGTLDALEIENWTMLCLSFVEAAKRAFLDKPRACDLDNLKRLMRAIKLPKKQADYWTERFIKNTDPLNKLKKLKLPLAGGY